MGDLVCKTDNLTEKIRWQKEAVERLKEEIFGTDKRRESKYIRDFMLEFQDFEAVSTYQELLESARNSRIIYLGDYHALDKCQQFQAGFLQDLADQPVILAVELFYGRDQRALDDWMSGGIDDAQLLRRVRYRLEWGYNWDSYRAVLEVARKNGIPVSGIDCAPRNDFRYIRKRDTAVAAKIVDLLQRNPGHKLVVSFGESHLATNHLPRKVDRHFAPGQAPPGITVLQNLDEVYWKIACDGLEDERVVKLKDRTYCFFNATPFEKYEGYSRQLEIWKAQSEEDQRLDLTSTVYKLIDAVLEFTRIDKYTYCLRHDGVCLEFFIDGYPEVYSHEKFEDFKRLLHQNHDNKAHIKQIINHTRLQGSCYVPGINAIFIGKFDLVHGAEEAAHFVNFALKGQRYQHYRPKPLDAATEFYLTTLEEALGYFGSKLIAPGRNHCHESDILHPERLDRPARKRLGVPAEKIRWMRAFLHNHKIMECQYHRMRDLPRIISRGFRTQGRIFAILSHELGYLLGEQLYRGYRDGEFSRREISQLFRTRFEEGGSPIEAYFTLAERAEPLPIELESISTTPASSRPRG
jgi:Haem-binding uptake, Tiki superfamily, ChaN